MKHPLTRDLRRGTALRSAMLMLLAFSAGILGTLTVQRFFDQQEEAVAQANRDAGLEELPRDIRLLLRRLPPDAQVVNHLGNQWYVVEFPVPPVGKARRFLYHFQAVHESLPDGRRHATEAFTELRRED